MKKLTIFLLCALVSYGVWADRSDTAIKQLGKGKVKQALKTLKSEDNKGSSKATYFLGRVYELGIGVKTDISKAANYYKKAADRGNVRAMNRYGLMRMNGDGVVQNYENGADYVCKAAQKDDLSGIFNCAIIYYEGTGRDRNYAKAVELFKKAADKNHIGALNSLGVYYLGDKKRKPDYQKSAEYLKKSADLGSAQGMYEYASLLSREGSGITDLITAHKYFNLASFKGLKEARTKRAALAKKMKPEQIKEAQQQADLWNRTWLMVRTAHSNDSVYIDDMLLGPSGSTKYRVSPGKHVVVIKKDGYQDKTMEIEVKAGEGLRLPAKDFYTLKKK